MSEPIEIGPLSFFPQHLKFKILFSSSSAKELRYSLKFKVFQSKVHLFLLFSVQGLRCNHFLIFKKIIYWKSTNAYEKPLGASFDENKCFLMLPIPRRNEKDVALFLHFFEKKQKLFFNNRKRGNPTVDIISELYSIMNWRSNHAIIS